MLEESFIFLNPLHGQLETIIYLYFDSLFKDGFSL